MQAYSDPKRANDPYALPDAEYWFVSAKAAKINAESGEDETEAGWYWWPCFPGCLPDGDPIGPFATEADCIADFTSESEDM